MIMQKEQAHKLIDWMPQSFTGDDLVREVYVREVILQGMADSNEERTKNIKEVLAKFNLPAFRSVKNQSELDK